MQESSWVVIPTYNERENLEPLLAGITEYFSGSILIIDDQSPDGTGDFAEELRARYPRLTVLHRPQKTGLAQAYREGLRLVLDRGATTVIHCDADRSHPASVLPQILSGLRTADLVVASRYAHGGKIQIPLHRRLISLIGNWYIRLLLGSAVHDWSSGYCGWRRGTLRASLQASTSPVGYAWLIEMKWRAVQLHARVHEVPFIFTDRTRGKSKFSLAIMLEDLRTAWRLRFGR